MTVQKSSFVLEIKQILERARQNAYTAINTAMVDAYWFVGKRIVEEEQQGKNKADYGEGLLKALSTELSNTMGKGFSLTNIRYFRQFYLSFPLLNQQTYISKHSSIHHTPCDELNYAYLRRLSWSHIRQILKVSNKGAQAYYLKEAAENSWSVRTLDRNIVTLYYQRLLSSQLKEPVEKEMIERTKTFKEGTFEFIKNPVVLEFLNLPSNVSYTEREFETALIDNLQRFLLELGKGFAFVARQQLIRTESSDFYIDLVFYNYLLKCFVVVDLKTDKITHQDIGQLDMYVRMYDDLQRTVTDNPTIGILLCTETDKTIARYSILNQNENLFATKYMPYLPTEAELVAEIEREKMVLKQQFEQHKAH